MSNHDQFLNSNPVWIELNSPDGHTPDLTEYPNSYPGTLLEGEAAATVLQGYEDAGRHLAQPKIPEDESFVADGALFDDSYGRGYEWGVIRNRLDPKIVERRTRQVGKYNINNRRIGYVDETGRLIVARGTANNVRALLGARYLKGSVTVPFSTAEQPVPDSLPDLHARLFAELDVRDELATGGLTHHPSELFDPHGSVEPVILATRSVAHIQSEASADYRATRDMDPDAVSENMHNIQALRDKIALTKLAELE